MSSILTASSRHTDGNVPDFTSDFIDGNDALFMAFWPRMYQENFQNDPSAPSAISTVSRKMTKDEHSDSGKSTSAGGKKKKKKETETTPSTGSGGSGKKKKPGKKPEPSPEPILKKPPPPAAPVKKHKNDIGASGKNKPVADSPPLNVPDPPQGEEMNPEPAVDVPEEDELLPETAVSDNNPESDEETDTFSEDESPDSQPTSDTDFPGTDEYLRKEPSEDGGSFSVPETDSVPPATESDGSDTLSADPDPAGENFLTEDPVDDFMDERMDPESPSGFFSGADESFKDLIGDLSTEKSNPMIEDITSDSYVPVVLPPPGNPVVEPDPVGSFRAGYISQNDIEEATGRDEWTMCCATTFVYAVQVRYPGLGRNEILEAAGQAANTSLSDGSGCCVSDSGYIRSIYQYSQALSRNLGLNEYIDSSGEYPSIEAAREAGAEVMKVKLSGTLRGRQQEHHVLQVNAVEMDPAGGNGIDMLWDAGSRNEVSVMALGWYTLP